MSGFRKASAFRLQTPFGYSTPPSGSIVSSFLAGGDSRWRRDRRRFLLYRIVCKMQRPRSDGRYSRDRYFALEPPSTLSSVGCSLLVVLKEGYIASVSCCDAETVERVLAPYFEVSLRSQYSPLA